MPSTLLCQWVSPHLKIHTTDTEWTSAREFKETQIVTVLGLVTQLKGKKGDEYVNKWDDLH